MKWNGWDNLHAISNNMLKEPLYDTLNINVAKIGRSSRKESDHPQEELFFLHIHDPSKARTD